VLGEVGEALRDPHPRPLPSRGRGAATAVLVALLLLLTLLFSLPALAQERIMSFSSALTLAVDGAVDVTETIEVISQGIEIRRGIYRDIPTLLINDDNSRLRSTLNVKSVSRNGNSEPYALESIGNGFTRIRIGSADVFLNDGVHRYTIRYTMTRMARRFDDHDEIFWNATGNYWVFPIAKAVSSITLPPGAVVGDVVGYTGKAGSKEQAVTITRGEGNQVIVRANRPLAPGEGMSVAVAFQKGILASPDSGQQAIYWLSDHRDLVLPGFAALIVLLYNLFAWSAVGRDPAKGTIIPLFHPPKGFSPGLVHYIHRMGWQKMGWTAFTAAIFDLGVKGLVTIDNSTKTLRVTSTGKSGADLQQGEQIIQSYIASKGTVSVDTSNGPKLNETRGAFIKAIESENRQVYFRNNSGYVVLGFLISAGLLGALVLLDLLQPVFLFVAVIGGVAVGLFTSIATSIWNAGALQKFIILAWVVIAGANLFGGFSGFVSQLNIDTPLIAAISIVIINVAFAILMRAPTVQGRRLMDQIDGFKMYLDTAEKNRLNIVGEPPMTVERFEGILPYAIALGVEKPWSEHFEGELSRNAVAGADSNYHPGFYSGRNWSSGGFSNTVSSVASGMSAAMMAAQPSTSSGSGFSGGGGGGSSGGGGGGGGGGW
jgi:hypothetical protein